MGVFMSKTINVANGSDHEIWVMCDIDQTRLKEATLRLPNLVGVVDAGQIQLSREFHHTANSVGRTKMMPGETTPFEWKKESGTVYVSIYYESDKEDASNSTTENKPETETNLICNAFSVKFGSGIIVSRSNTARRAKPKDKWIDTDGINHFRKYQPPNLPFNSIPIFQEKSNGEIVLNRFRDAKLEWKYGKYFGLRFTVDKTIEILGYGFYGSKKGTETFTIEAQLYCYTQEKNLIETKFEDVRNDRIIVKYFDRPVEVLSGSKYSAVAKLEGPPTYCGEQGREKISCDTSSGQVNFKFSRDPFYKAESPLETGQLPQIIFRVKK